MSLVTYGQVLFWDFLGKKTEVQDSDFGDHCRANVAHTTVKARLWHWLSDEISGERHCNLQCLSGCCPEWLLLFPSEAVGLGPCGHLIRGT